MAGASKRSFVVFSALSIVVACGDEDGKKSSKDEKRGVKDPGMVDVAPGGSSGAVSGAGEGGSQSGGSTPRTTAAGEGGASDGGFGAGGAGRDDAGGAGGEAGATTSGPLTIGNPKNKTVLEGSDATFSVTGAGSAVGYQWQQLIPGYQFGDIAGATSELLTLQAVPLSLDRSSYRAIATRGSESVTSTSATLSVIPRDSGAYVALDSGAAHQQHTALTSWSTATYAGVADLQAGTLAASADTPDNQLTSSAQFSVRLYNNSGSTIVLPPGALQAHVDSSYVGSPLYYNTSSLITTVVLSAAASAAMDHGGSASLVHQVSLTGSTDRSSTRLIEQPPKRARAARSTCWWIRPRS